ncbi:MAG: SUMF1/EgtB/PvdO family nonheme iron enzyme [Flavobacteriales bacterium]
MKKSLLFILSAALLASCAGGPNGELVGAYPREEWDQINPYGMNYIPYGSFTMGASDEDISYAHTTTLKTVTVPAFYIDQTEITNNEYRQFVNWVRDSLQRDVLANADIEGYKLEDRDDGRDWSTFVTKGYVLNWETPIDMYNEEVFDALYDQFYVKQSERFYDRQEIDPRVLNFKYWWIDYKGASVRRGNSEFKDRYDSDRDYELGAPNSLDQLHSIRWHSDRSQFIIEETINIYPDTLCWVHDYTYGFNEPLTESYFWHPAYDDYPVVGITWGQSLAFCAWRTQILNEFKFTNEEAFVQRFRLPTEAEWEFAARGGLDLSPYPWGGPYVRNNLGCPLANFKPMRGDYVEDGGCHTVPVYSYSPNEYGLYCMAGNVAEWTSTAFDESVYQFTHDMSPEYDYRAKGDDQPSMKRKVIRGGSWKDIGYFIQNGSRAYEYQDTSKSYIGFRCVMSYLGRGKNVAAEDLNEE